MDLITLALAKKYANKKFAEAVNFGGFEIVSELPTVNISTTTIYLLQIATSSDSDLYKEYVYVNNQWESIGTIGLSAYDIAIENGFEGSVTEWLESLKGDSGVYVGSGEMPGDCNVQIDIDGEPYRYELTEAEKTEIAQMVYDMLPKAEEASL